MHARLLIALRKHTGLSHEEIAARAGLSPATVRTHEAASPHAMFTDSMRISSGLGFDFIITLFLVDRLLEEAGTPSLPDKKPWSDARFIKLRCSVKDGITPAEIRRQLRVMRALTLPKRPGPPNRKRPAATRTARAASATKKRAQKSRKT